MPTEGLVANNLPVPIQDLQCGFSQTMDDPEFLEDLFLVVDQAEQHHTNHSIDSNEHDSSNEMDVSNSSFCNYGIF